MFNCPLCKKPFGWASRFDRHMFTHTKEKPYKCPMFAEAFSLESNLKTHIKNIHDGIKQLRNKSHHCTMCSYKCSYKGELEIHVRKHSAELPFSCKISSCGYKTKYKCALTQHGRQAHSGKRSFKCPADGCSYKATTRTYIRRHLTVHSNDKPFVCTGPGCNFTCKSKVELKSHRSRVHSNDKPFKCSVCDFRTKVRQDLRRHELTHTRIKRFLCQAPNCGYASNQRNDLKTHFDRKHRTKEVLCTEPRCDLRCGSIALLKVHLKRHKLPMLKCPSDSCGFRTKYNPGLLRHISRRHNDFQSSITMAGARASDLKTAGTILTTLQCSFTDCSFQTKFRQQYDRHLVTHKKEEKRQHVLDIPFCSFRFSQLSLLQAHVQRHTLEKPYSCFHCYYTSKESFDLRRHARKIHQIHVITCGKDDEERKCRTCGRNCLSYGESVLHSMSHLQPVVVLKQLKLHVL